MENMESPSTSSSDTRSRKALSPIYESISPITSRKKEAHDKENDLISLDIGSKSSYDALFTSFSEKFFTLR